MNNIYYLDENGASSLIMETIKKLATSKMFTDLREAIIAGDDELLKKITDPDNYPISSTEEAINVSPVIELGGIDRNNGDLTERVDAVRTKDFIPVTTGKEYRFINGQQLKVCVTVYDSNKQFISSWNDSYSYAYIGDGNSIRFPNTVSYIKFYCSSTDDTTVPFVISYNEMRKELAGFAKQYFPAAGYALEPTEFDPGLYDIELSASNDEFAIFTIKAPKSKPHEATLTLKCSGADIKQFADISCMKYHEGIDGQICIICQSRGDTTPLPDFYIGFNDGKGAGRIQKFKIEPDAIPIQMTNQGLRVRRDNTFDNSWTDSNSVNVNLARLAEGIFKTVDGVFQTAIVHRTDDLGIEYEEYWVFVNATYDETTNKFKRIDTTKNSFGIQFQGKGTYPGEAALGDTVNQAIGFWRATGSDYFNKAGDTQTAASITEYIGYDDNGTWKDFGVQVGWNNCFMIDSYGGMTIGGAGFEIDGNGIAPYGRISLSKFGGGSTDKNIEDYQFGVMGLMWNAYHQMFQSDHSDEESYFCGMRAPINFYYDNPEQMNPYANHCDMKNGSFVFMKRNANAGHKFEDWSTLFEVTTNGDVFANGKKLETEVNTPVAVECQILDQYSFQVNAYPPGFDKTNSILIANKVKLIDGSIKNIKVDTLTYTDYGILGVYSGAEQASIDKLYIYLKKVDPI